MNLPPPFVSGELTEKIRGMNNVVYGVYGEHDLLDIHLFESIQCTLQNNSQNTIGAPIFPKSIGVITGENSKTIRITALYN